MAPIYLYIQLFDDVFGIIKNNKKSAAQLSVFNMD